MEFVSHWGNATELRVAYHLQCVYSWKQRYLINNNDFEWKRFLNISNMEGKTDYSYNLTISSLLAQLSVVWTTSYGRGWPHEQWGELCTTHTAQNSLLFSLPLIMCTRLLWVHPETLAVQNWINLLAAAVTSWWKVMKYSPFTWWKLII